MRLAICLICGWVFAGLLAPVNAGATGTSNASIPDYTGLLFSSGASLAPLGVQTDYLITNPTFAPQTGTYRVGFRLVDANGVSVSDEVFTAAGTVTIAARGNVRGTVSATLHPAGLNDGDPYRVASRVYAFAGNPKVWTPAGIESTGQEYRFHIANPADGAALAGWINDAYMDRAFAVSTVPGLNTFLVQVAGVIVHWDPSVPADQLESVSVYVDLQVTGAATGDVPLVSSRATLPMSVASAGPGGQPATAVLDQGIEFLPVSTPDPTDVYEVRLTISVAGPDGVEQAGNAFPVDGVSLLQFSGRLVVGGVEMVVRSIANEPDALGVDPGGGGESSLLALPPGGAELRDFPAYTVSPAVSLHVVLGTDGTATSADPVAFTSSTQPDRGTLAGISFTRDGVTVDGAGLHGYCTVRLPAGMGVGVTPGSRRLIADFPAGSVDLDGALNPSGVVLLNPINLDRATVFAVHESLPEFFETDGIRWDTAAGTLTVHRLDTAYVRASEMSTLDALPLLPENIAAKQRPSNEQLLAHPVGGGAGGDIVIQADASGRAVLASAEIDLLPASYSPHFPPGTTIAWDNPGTLLIANGLVDTAQSSLSGAHPVTVPVRPGAPDLSLALGVDEYPFTPSGAVWTFTPDMGLRAEGLLDPATGLRWGARDAVTFAQQTDPFVSADMLIPGFHLAGDLGTTSTDNRPGELLYTGQGRPGDPGYVERPGNPDDYRSGFADYAGINLRVAADGERSATSLVGDATLGPYPLRSITKYYARLAGVSGRHAAVQADLAAAAAALKVYGFAMQFTDYQLSFLDNINHDSRVPGSVTVPGVNGLAGFTQPFDRVAFDSTGHPTELSLPDLVNLEHSLAYWHVQFHPVTAEFLASDLDASLHALVFGAEVEIPSIVKEPLHGNLGFLNDGNLAAASRGIHGVDSRLRMPKQVTLHGTRSVSDPSHPGFTIHPVADLYFNNPAVPGAPPQEGFVAFAGTINVSFFEDLRVHCLARAGGSHTLLRAGWDKGGHDFFNDVHFDPDNRGFPESEASLDAYANTAEPVGLDYYDPDTPGHDNRNVYNPAVRQSWLGVVNFEMPVQWDDALRRFTSTVPEQRKFLVVESQRVLQQLTPSGADIRFGLQFEKLPRLNLAALVIDEQEASRQLIDYIPNGPQLVSALQAFNDLLNNRSDVIVTQALERVVDEFLQQTVFIAGGPVDGLKSAPLIANALGDPGVRPQLASDLQQRLDSFLGTAQDAVSVMRTLHDALSGVNDGLSAADSLLAKDATGKRGTFLTKTLAMATAVGIPAEDVDPVTESIDNLINDELAPTLDEIQDSVNDVHDLTQTANESLGDLQSALESALGTAKAVEGLPDLMVGSMKDYFARQVDPTGNYLSEVNPDVLRADLKRAILDVLGQSGFITEVQTDLHELIEPIHDEYRGVFDQILGVMNDVVRSSLQTLSDEVVDHLNDSVGKLNRTIGAFNETLQMTQIEGQAHIVGDVIDNARINGTISLHVPDAVTLKGSVEFKRLHADQAVPTCAVGVPDGRMQITVQASGSAGFAGVPPTHASAEARYTMSGTGDPLALFGKLSVDSDLHFDIIGLKHAEFDLAFGKYDNYLRAAGAGSILVFDVDVQSFMGRTCDMEMLKGIDPQIGTVFSKLGMTPPDGVLHDTVTGYYWRGDGDVVLNRLFEIPDDIVTLKAKGGQGSFAFCNDSLTKLIIGLHTRLGVAVGFGPLSVDTTFTALGALDPLDLIKELSAADISTTIFRHPALIRGVVPARFSATFGTDPFSKTFNFDFTASGSYTPPPLAPPPGFFFVEHIDF